MESNQYTYMFEVEDRHWWYVGNHEIFLQTLQRETLLHDGIHLLDAGCGTGKWLEIVKKSYDLHETGIDYNQLALDYSKTRGTFNLRLADINTYVFDEAPFDLITSFDVICNSNIDDVHALRSFHTFLKDDGHLLLTVPAYQFLLSTHDTMVHQNKRYTKRQLKLLLESNGYEIIKISYCVCLLFPIAMIKRLLDKVFASKERDHNEVKMPNNIMNRLFLFVMHIEKFLLRYMSLPFGLSVMVFAKKAT